MDELLAEKQMLIDERASGHYERKGETNRVELYQRKITIAKRPIVTAKNSGFK
jgi:hypothetical protein